MRGAEEIMIKYTGKYSSNTKKQYFIKENHC